MIPRLVVLSLLLAAMGAAQTALAEDPGIRKLVTAYMDAWNAHDARAVAANFADDADFTNQAGKSFHGRQAIQRIHHGMLSNMLKDSRQKATDVQVRMITADVAAVDVSWELASGLEIDGAATAPRTGLMSWVATRHGDRWLITVMHNLEFHRKGQAVPES